ncbi:MAG: FHA domain-containing protein [Deltaproteobacteria bacterium]|nr:FHA domain-containing protein [Deltaproteobacteria bacterium]
MDSTFPLEGQLLIGRSPDADVQLLDTGVSRRHCTLLEDDSGQVILVDLSTNGTIVGGEAINRLRLLVGDVVHIGECQFVLEDSDGQGAAEPSDQIKLASGPATVDTDVNPPSDLGCGSSLHLVAIQRAWGHCPMCGNIITDDERAKYG